MVKKIYLKNTINIISMFIILFFVIEIFFRIFISILVGNSLSFSYGLNNDIKIQINDLSKLKIRVVNNNFYNHTIYSDEIKNTTEEKLELWAFGGSTTAGYNCSNKSSSWPEELEKIDPKALKVINYGRNGTNSDFAYIELLAALQNDVPDWVLWANRVNETDVIYSGLKKNKHKILLGHNKVKNYNNIKLYFHRLSKTLENNSIFYYVFTDFSERLIWKLNLTTPLKNIDYTDGTLNIAAKNFEYNIIDLQKISEFYKFKIAIITLVQKKELQDTIKSNFSAWDLLYLKKVKELSTLNNIYWINSIDWDYNLKNKNKISNSLFCDGVHQTLEGNRQTSIAIYEKFKILD
ncbi:SGNH/GDSL hydrolase family protein [Alphaproteobacteria bacterium]|nr:SGNH/GDSL hydrolase family protein [Alphaproteobacteria bacterium]